MSEPFWANNPKGLFTEPNFIPCQECGVEVNLNRLTRFVLYLSVILSALRRTTKWLYMGLFLVAVIGILYFLSPNKMKKSEAFGNIYDRPKPAVPVGFNYTGALGPGDSLPQYYSTPEGSPYFYGKQEGLLNQLNNPTAIHNMGNTGNPGSPYQTPLTNYGVGPQAVRVTADVLNAPDSAAFFQDPVLRAPTSNNPFMNVMPLDYGAPPVFDNYNRYEKVNYPTPESQNIREEVKSNFEKGLYQNAGGKLWDRMNSQREYVSQPVGSVPNDQAEFANWLYGAPEGRICKTGSVYDRYGLKYTDDSLVCNGFNVASPSNKGLLNGGLMSSVAKDPGMYQQ